jgi:uncharacterized membrane protein
MYSKVKVLGHPVHPMLVAFPVAFYTGTLVAFIAYAASSEPFWYRVGWVANWAGVATAAVAALPGFIDWAVGIPRHSAAKRTGLIHMGLNVTALVLFLICAIVATNHHDDAVPPANSVIVLSLLGVLLTLPSGFLGWSLVQDHHVGVKLSPAQERLEPTTEPPPRERSSAPLASR